MKNIFVLAVCVLTMVATVNAYKILVLVPINEKANWNFMQTIIEELMNRGHKITCITSRSATHMFKVHENYTEILIDPPFKVEMAGVHKDIEWMHNYYSSIWTTSSIAAASAKWAIEAESVQQFLVRSSDKFDLVINDECYHESWLMFGRRFRAPVISIASTGRLEILDRYTGLVTPYSHVSHSTLGLGETMSFLERFYNTWFSMANWYYHHAVHIKLQDQIALTHLSSHMKVNTVYESIQDIPIFLVNAHPMLWPPRPTMPNLIHIGGAHLKKKPHKLPIEIQTFLDGATDGVVVVYVEKTFDMETLQIFFDAFESLTQRILWHYENSTLANIPSNVLCYTEFSRYDALNDPNVVLYVSNTDYFESLYYSVPILMLPLNEDQRNKAERIETLGCGFALNPNNNLTMDKLSMKLVKLIRNPNVTSKVIAMSKILKKDIVHPMDRAMYWIEYVVRHNGAKHLQSSAAQLPFYYYLQWDIFGPMVFLSVVALFYGLYRLVDFLIPINVWTQ